MKILLIATLLMSFINTCNNELKSVEGNHYNNVYSMKLKITVGPDIFIATLESNKTVQAFTLQLPMTIQMNELNGNEKYFDLSVSLPTSSANPGKIQEGDLMLYGSNTLVIFYKSFSTSYSYTKLGRINNTEGLKVALGTGGVTIKFELE